MFKDKVEIKGKKNDSNSKKNIKQMTFICTAVHNSQNE